MRSGALTKSGAKIQHKITNQKEMAKKMPAGEKSRKIAVNPFSAGCNPPATRIYIICPVAKKPYEGHLPGFGKLYGQGGRGTY
jgi:hypothetical protein